MNFKKLSAIGMFGLCLAVSTGCTTSGRPVSDYKDLQLYINYSDTFNLEPTSNQIETVYLQARDLTGNDVSENFKNYLIYNLRTEPEFMLTNNPSEATLIVYATIKSVSTDSTHGYVGTVAGAAGGVITGSIIESNSHHGYYDYGGYNSWIPLLFAGIGAGIGYAIDSSTAIQNITVIEDVEIRQCQEAECKIYNTELTVKGNQLNMNKGEALSTIMSHSARGITELLKH